MNDFRFLHAADIHLDSPLIGLGKFEEASAEQVHAARHYGADHSQSLNRDRLRQVPRLIHVRALQHRNVIGKQL